MRNKILVELKVIAYQNRSLSFAFAALLALGSFRPALAENLKHYTVIDLGTLGGTFSFPNGLTNNGQIDGVSTLLGDQIQRAFLWRDGLMTDLGTLGGQNSIANWPMNERGEVPVWSETTTPDPNKEDFCSFGTLFICLPAVWRQGVLTPLPTLGNNAIANEVNNRGQVVGASEITTPDSTCQFVLGIKPVIWERDENEEDNQAEEHRRWEVSELPLFPGDSAGRARSINDRGQVAGFSRNCSGAGTVHALLWENGMPTDLGNLGGRFSQPFDLNNQGQVVGLSNLSGDMNNHAFLWQDGVMTDLGTLPGDVDSIATSINEKGHVVGGSVDAGGNERAFLWQNGVMTDLNTLIPTGSPVFLFEGEAINARGQIAVVGLQISSGQVHGFLATPCHAESGCGTTTGAETLSPKVVVPENMRKLLKRRFSFGRPGVGGQ